MLGRGFGVLAVPSKLFQTPAILHLLTPPPRYEEIGVPIVITMIINMISPHIFSVVDYTRKGWSQCMDRSCSGDHTLTKQVTQHELEAMYTGPEFIL